MRRPPVYTRTDTRVPCGMLSGFVYPGGGVGRRIGVVPIDVDLAVRVRARVRARRPAVDLGIAQFRRERDRTGQIEIRMAVGRYMLGGHGEGRPVGAVIIGDARIAADHRSEEHTSELQSLMRISSAVFCLK